jgi:hypothetical protein
MMQKSQRKKFEKGNAFKMKNKNKYFLGSQHFQPEITP